MPHCRVLTLDCSLTRLSSGIGENIDVSWEERYAIAASNDSFMRGIRFNVRNDYTPINYGQKYVLRKNWSGGVRTLTHIYFRFHC
jgi:hypothetical protein